jgi:hypothetical protein
MKEPILIEVSIFEAGMLMGLIESRPDMRDRFKGVMKQLLNAKLIIEEESGVKRKLLSNGKILMTDRDGNQIIRNAYAWEYEREPSLRSDERPGKEGK